MRRLNMTLNNHHLSILSLPIATLLTKGLIIYFAIFIFSHLLRIDDSSSVNNFNAEVKSLASSPFVQEYSNPITLSSLGIPELLPLDIFEERRKKIKISVVMSYCSADFEWLFDYIDSNRYNIDRFTIYSKCHNNMKQIIYQKMTLLAPSEIFMLPNVGRCDHTYATWMLNNYESIQNNAHHDNGDIVLFVKDNNYHKAQFYSFDELFTFTTETGFGCIEKPVCDCDHPNCNERGDIPLILHNQTILDRFKINSHLRIERDNHSKSSFKNKRYPNLKSWKDEMGYVIPHSEAIPVCYGGMFAVQKKQIIKQPKETWTRIVDSLSRGDNIVEGHYCERLWAPALSGTGEDYAKRVTDAILPHIFDTFPCWNRQGMLMAEKTKGFHSDLFDI